MLFAIYSFSESVLVATIFFLICGWGSLRMFRQIDKDGSLEKEAKEGLLAKVSKYLDKKQP